MKKEKIAEMLNNHEELLGKCYREGRKEITVDLEWYMELVELAINELHGLDNE